MPSTSEDAPLGSVFRRTFGRFLAAVQFLTRIPTPAWTPSGPTDVGASAAFFPLVGLLVGGLASVALWVVRSLLDFPPMVGSLVCVGVAVVITGFLHEDGFADLCDALGGSSPQRRREIMRDSRVGAFGATGLVIVVGSELALLASLSVAGAVSALLCAHMTGRFASVLLLRVAKAPSDPSSVAKPYLEGVDNRMVFFATITEVAVLLVLSNVAWTSGILLGTVVAVVAAKRLFNRWLGGVSGDCLGALTKAIQLLVLCLAVHPKFPLPPWAR